MDSPDQTNAVSGKRKREAEPLPQRDPIKREAKVQARCNYSPPQLRRSCRKPPPRKAPTVRKPLALRKSANARKSSKETKINCSLCTYTTNTLLNLYSHEKQRHNAKDPFKCPACPVVAKSKHFILKHATAIHGGWEESLRGEWKEGKKEESLLMLETREDGDSSVDEDIKLVGKILEAEDGSTEDGDEESGMFHCLEADCTFTTAKRRQLRFHLSKRHKYKLRKYERLPEGSGGPPRPKKGPPYGPYKRRSQDRKFACSQCSYRTHTSWHLSNHIRHHTGEKPFACERSGCDARFAKQYALRRHVENVHCSEKSVMCELCSFVCSSQEYLRAHTAHKHGTKETCPYCTFRTCRSLAPHILKLHPHVCGECTWEFRSGGELEAHLARHTLGGGLHCEHCNELTTREEIAEHYRSAHGQELKFRLCFSKREQRRAMRILPSCEVCSYEFETMESLTAHRRLHTGAAGVIKCGECGTELPGMAELLEHLAEKHDVKEPEGNPRPLETLSLRCTICAYDFYSQTTLQRHIEHHQPDGSIRCSLCPFISAKMRDLVQHERLVHGVGAGKRTRLHCSLCSRSFTSAPQLHRHVRSQHAAPPLPPPLDASSPGSHVPPDASSPVVQQPRTPSAEEAVNEDMFRCPICGWVFEAKAEADIHIQCHLPDGMLACSLCPHRSLTMEILRVHLAHTHNVKLRARRPSEAGAAGVLGAAVPPSFLFHAGNFQPGPTFTNKQQQPSGSSDPPRPTLTSNLFHVPVERLSLAGPQLGPVERLSLAGPQFGPGKGRGGGGHTEYGSGKRGGGEGHTEYGSGERGGEVQNEPELSPTADFTLPQFLRKPV